MLGDFISFSAGLALVFISVLVVRAYWPPRYDDASARWLGAAIILGFLASGFNALYWQVWSNISLMLDLTSVQSLRGVGDFLDLAFKGGAAVAGWMHLKAIHSGIPEQDRKSWSVWEMPWYPDRRRCLRRLFGGSKK